MAIIWKESPNAVIFFEPSAGEFYVEGASGLSEQAAKALAATELIRIGHVTSLPAHTSLKLPPSTTARRGRARNPTLDALGQGFQHLGFYPPGEFGGGTEGVTFARVYDRDPLKVNLNFDRVYKNRIERD